jgi:drug/metabolite transporter (DMT)-like permease
VYLFTLTAFFKGIARRVQSWIFAEQRVASPQLNDSVNSDSPIDASETASLLPATETKSTRYTNRMNSYFSLITHFTALLFLIPACCDLGGTTLMNVGLFYTDASIYQMLRGILVVFNGILAVIFLKQRLYYHHWFGIFLITGGTAMVGLSSYIYRGEDKESVSRNPLLGNALVVAAQVLAATQSVIEEKILNAYPAEPLQVVGYEGFWGLSMTSVVLFCLYWVPGSDYHSMENSVYAFAQLAQDWRLMAATIGSICSIAFFNFFGISITQRVSSTTRSAIDSCRTFFIWMVSLAVGWETFRLLQLGGFIVVIIGTFMFNEVIKIPIYHKWYLGRKEAYELSRREKKLIAESD